MPTSAIASAPSPRRSLRLGALVLYGIILIQPTAPIPLFGVTYEKAGGHIGTLILIGLVAMMFAALGYGRVANAYPSVSSASACSSREFHAPPRLGSQVRTIRLSRLHCRADAPAPCPPCHAFSIWITASIRRTLFLQRTLQHALFPRTQATTPTPHQT